MTTNYMGGYPATIQSMRQESAVIKWTLSDLVSRAELVMAAGVADAAYEIGTVVGKILRGAQTVAAAVAGGSNAGNGVFTPAATAADPAAMAGTWRVEFFVPAANLGWLIVTKPDGTVDGFGKVGTAYNGGIKFTIADGSNDFAAGDFFTQIVSYAAGSGKYVPVNAAAVDGSQNAAAILYARAFVPVNTDVIAGGVNAYAVVLADALLWPDGATTDQIAAWIAQLAALGIVSKNQV